jgi:hypothetical protein
LNYTTLSRRIVDRHIKDITKRGTRFTTFNVKSKGCEPVVLSAYIQRRAPKSKVMLDLDYFNKVKIVVYTPQS